MPVQTALGLNLGADIGKCNLDTNTIFGQQHKVLVPTKLLGTNKTFGHQPNILGINSNLDLELANFI
jgi:hypothetical protein